MGYRFTVILDSVELPEYSYGRSYLTVPYFGKLIEVERRRWFRPIQFAEVYYHRVLGARFVSGERQVSSELKAALDRFVAKIDSKEPWIDRIAIPSAIVVKK